KKKPKPALSSDLPTIDAGEGDLQILGKAAWDAMVKANAPPAIYRSGTIPSRIESDDSGNPIVRVLNRGRVRHRLAHSARWIRFVGEDGDIVEKPAHQPPSVVEYVLATPNPELPILRRIVKAPVFAADGSICTQPGYDPRSCAFFFPDPGFELQKV